MSAIDRIQHELDMQGIKPSKMMSDLGFSSGLFTQWKNKNQNPSLSKLESISNYLKVDINYLRQDELREKRKEKEGFCYNEIEAESQKNHSREKIRNYNLSDTELIDEGINILKALYSRSLAACWYDPKHIEFKDYCAMMLNQNANNICKELSAQKYQWLKDELIKKFGQKPGIPQGTHYNIDESKPTLAQKAIKKSLPATGTRSDLIGDIDDLTDEEAIDLKDYIKYLKSKRQNQEL